MLPDLYPPYPTIVDQFFEILMDGKNLITEAQVERILFVSQILDSTQALLHQHS